MQQRIALRFCYPFGGGDGILKGMPGRKKTSLEERGAEVSVGTSEVGSWKNQSCINGLEDIFPDALFPEECSVNCLPNSVKSVVSFLSVRQKNEILSPEKNDFTTS